MRAAVVVPTNRVDRIQEFCAAWEPQFNRVDVALLVVEDHPEPEVKLPEWIIHLSHREISGMGIKGDCIPTYSGGIRSLGFHLAIKMHWAVDMILSLDDDCLPIEGYNLIEEHWRMLEAPRMSRWWPAAQFPTRGLPYGVRLGVQPVLNHGLWAGIPDVDAVSQLGNPNFRCEPTTESQDVPPSVYFPMCIMNVAFRPAVAPIMYMPKLPDGMKRWDDIWCGVIMKRLCDARGWPVTSGYPCVRHERASNVWANLRQEAGGMEINEHLWQVVDSAPVQGGDILTKHLLDDYLCIASRIRAEFPQLRETTENMRMWAELWGFQE